MQKAIISVLEAEPDNCANMGLLSQKVASLLGGRCFWRISDIDRGTEKGELLYALARSLHRRDELVRNAFSSSLSRALKSLEKRSIVQLQRNTFRYRDRKWWIVERDGRPRVKFVVLQGSRYYGLDCPEYEWLMDLARSIQGP